MKFQQLEKTLLTVLRFRIPLPVAYHLSGWKDERVNDYDKPAPGTA